MQARYHVLVYVLSISQVTYVTNFGLCSQFNGILALPSTVTFDAVRNSISGVIRGVSSITLVSSAELELYAAGRTFGQSGSECKDYIFN